VDSQRHHPGGEEQQPAGSRRLTTSPTDRAARSVLVVEDDPAIRRLVTMVLLRKGYRAEVAVDGHEALQKLSGAGVYDVIILDLMMPNLDGFGFLEKLIAREPERLRSVIVTSAASPNLIRDRMKGQTFRVLSKPFDIHELVAAIEACIAAQTEI
jgi:CheY-like chemotaxis protein